MVFLGVGGQGFFKFGYFVHLGEDSFCGNYILVRLWLGQGKDRA
jgi:hypothetical protein